MGIINVTLDRRIRPAKMRIESHFVQRDEIEKVVSGFDFIYRISDALLVTRNSQLNAKEVVWIIWTEVQRKTLKDNFKDLKLLF